MLTLPQPAARRRRALSLIALPLALSLAACGGGDGGAPADAAAEIDACSLIAVADAGKLLQTTLTAKKPDTASGNGLCNYLSSDSMDKSFLLVAGTRGGTDSPADYAASRKHSVVDDWKQSVGGEAKTEDVSGIGDAAFVFESADVTQLYVFVAKSTLMINRNVAPDPDSIALTEELARLALANLKS